MQSKMQKVSFRVRLHYAGGIKGRYKTETQTRQSYGLTVKCDFYFQALLQFRRKTLNLNYILNAKQSRFIPCISPNSLNFKPKS
jgi:hypothetical protein